MMCKVRNHSDQISSTNALEAMEIFGEIVIKIVLIGVLKYWHGSSHYGYIYGYF